MQYSHVEKKPASTSSSFVLNLSCRYADIVKSCTIGSFTNSTSAKPQQSWCAYNVHNIAEKKMSYLR